jgi:DNA-binding response OmpR family regulator
VASRQTAERGAGQTHTASGAEVTGARLLVVDDEQRILDFVARGLRAEGYAVDVARDGQAGLDAALSNRYDLVILDLLMPHLDGRQVLRRLLERKPGQAVLILSALSDTPTKVETLEFGAEDYLAKPFSLAELLARVRARLRAVARSGAGQVRVGRMSLDLVRREAEMGGGPIPLSERESLLLRELMQTPGRVQSKERLLSAVWGYHFEPGSNVVDVYVGRLRSKLGPDVIATVRGRGYLLAVD